MTNNPFDGSPSDYMRGGLADHVANTPCASGDLLFRLLCMEGYQHAMLALPLMHGGQPNLTRLWKAVQRNRDTVEHDNKYWKMYCNMYLDNGDEYLFSDCGESYDWEYQLDIYSDLIRKFRVFGVSKDAEKLYTRYINMEHDITRFVRICRDNNFII